MNHIATKSVRLWKENSMKNIKVEFLETQVSDNEDDLCLQQWLELWDPYFEQNGRLFCKKVTQLLKVEVEFQLLLEKMESSVSEKNLVEGRELSILIAVLETLGNKKCNFDVQNKTHHLQKRRVRLKESYGLKS